MCVYFVGFCLGENVSITMCDRGDDIGGKSKGSHTINVYKQECCCQINAIYIYKINNNK